MKIIVPVKRVVDHNVKVRLTADATDVERTNVKMSMNPFDEIAVEEALRLKEAGLAEEVIAVSIGAPDCIETIRTALAMGADRGILVKSDTTVEPLAAAKILKAICQTEAPRLVLLGKQAIDDDAGQTGAMLAALMGWPQATQAYRLILGAHTAEVCCETDTGLQTVEVRLPAVVTCDLRLNEPRYVSLPGKMKARSKPVVEMTARDLGVDTTPRLGMVKLAEPEPRPMGVKVGSVAELVDALEAAGVLK